MSTEKQVKPHISQTQLESLCRCPEAYRRRYIEGEVIPPGVAMLKGTAFHRGAETNFRQKMETHRDLPANEIMEATAAAFDDALNGSYALTDDERSRGAKVVLGEAKDAVVGLAEIHAKEQAPEYQPVMVEHSVRISLPNAPRDLLAIIDLSDERDIVTDFKTASRRKSQNDADSSVQLTIYAAAFEAETGRPPSKLRLDTVVQTKTKTVRDVIDTTRDASDIRPLVNRINVALQIIEAGVYLPTSPGNWFCSPRWCGYFADCRFVNSERAAKAAQSDGE